MQVTLDPGPPSLPQLPKGTALRQVQVHISAPGQPREEMVLLLFPRRGAWLEDQTQLWSSEREPHLDFLAPKPTRPPVSERFGTHKVHGL